MIAMNTKDYARRLRDVLPRCACKDGGDDGDGQRTHANEGYHESFKELFMTLRIAMP